MLPLRHLSGIGPTDQPGLRESPPRKHLTGVGFAPALDFIAAKNMIQFDLVPRDDLFEHVDQQDNLLRRIGKEHPTVRHALIIGIDVHCPDMT